MSVDRSTRSDITYLTTRAAGMTLPVIEASVDNAER